MKKTILLVVLLGWIPFNLFGGEYAEAFQLRLRSAIRSGNLPEVKKLVYNLEDIDDFYFRKSNNALGHAVSYEQLGIVKFLISKGADPKKGYLATPLRQAALDGNLEILDYIYHLVPHTKLEQTNAFVTASNWCRLDVLKYFVAKGIDVNGYDNVGNFALVVSLNSENLECFYYLLEQGANIDQKRRVKPGERSIFYGSTPFLQACIRGRVEEMRLLLSKGADIKATGAVGYTAIHAAMTGDSAEAIRFLLDLGFDINSKNSDGNTALYLARFKNKPKAEAELIRYMKEKGMEIPPKPVSPKR